MQTCWYLTLKDPLLPTALGRGQDKLRKISFIAGGNWGQSGKEICVRWQNWEEPKIFKLPSQCSIPYIFTPIIEAGEYETIQNLDPTQRIGEGGLWVSGPERWKWCQGGSPSAYLPMYV